MGRAMSRNAIEQRLYDEGAADARAGRPATPPAGGAKLADAYQDGYASIPAPAATTQAKTQAKTPKAKAPAARRAPAKRPRRNTRTPRPIRKAGRAFVAPIESNVVSGLTLLATAAGIAFLYNLLVHAETTATVIDRLVQAVKWLDSTSPIPYRN